MSQIPSGVGVGDGGFFSAMALTSSIALLVALLAIFGTGTPPRPCLEKRLTETGEIEEIPEDIKVVTRTAPYRMSCYSAFVGGVENNLLISVSCVFLPSSAPTGYEYTPPDMGIFFIGQCLCILIRSLTFQPWLAGRTNPYQRLAILYPAAAAGSTAAWPTLR